MLDDFKLLYQGRGLRVGLLLRMRWNEGDGSRDDIERLDCYC
jgi:hypothetical protein